MIKISFNFLTTKLDRLIDKYNYLYGDHLNYYTILLNEEDFNEFCLKKNKNEKTIKNTNAKYFISRLHGKDIIFLISDTLKKNEVIINMMLDDDQTELSKNII